jgi:hypothetical protein
MATSKSRNAVGASNPREDARLHHDPASAVRGARSREDAARQSDDGTALTLEQRRAMIRNEFLQEALPRVPEMSGWHLCWLSTTNSYDPIHKRMRLGYVPVKVEELTGFDSMRMTSGEFAGCVSCNEMLLFKIPSETYQAIMAEFHHNMPLEEEDALRRQLDELEGSRDRTGKKLGQISEDSDGFNDLGKKREGVFAD